MVRPEQALANASSTSLATIGHGYDLEALPDLLTRAEHEAKGENYEQARMLFVEALDGYESLAGPCHYSTVEALSSFVSFCESQNLFDDAKDRMVKSLLHHEEELGRQDLSTLESTARLGHFYMRQKQYGLSETNLTAAKIGFENAFRLDPEDCLIVTWEINEDLIKIHEQQGDLERCEREYFSKIREVEALQSTQQPFIDMVFEYKHSLTHIYQKMWKGRKRIYIHPNRPPPLMKAENLLLDILEFAERPLNVNPNVLSSIWCSLEILREQYHSFDEDEKLGFLLHRIANKISGNVNAKDALSPRAVRAVQNKLLELELGMARSYIKLGNRKDAERWLLRRHGQIEQSLGSDSWEAISSLVGNARFYLDRDEWEAAEPLLRDALHRAENPQALESEGGSQPARSLKRRIAQCLEDHFWEPCCPGCGI